MILYLDTSALVKAYISENSSKEVLAAMKQVEIVASHRIAYVEAHAIFSRINREKKLSENECGVIRNTFNQDWNNYLHIESSQDLMQRAAELADVFALR